MSSIAYYALCPIRCFRRGQQKATNNKPVFEKMAPEIWLEGKKSTTDSLVKNISEDFHSSVAQDAKPQKTIDYLVDLLSNGDIGKQREAAEELTCRLRRGRDRIREIGATTLLVDRLSSPDASIREHMMTLLFRLAADEEDKYRHQSRRPPSGDRTVQWRTTAGVIHSLLRVGPGPKAYETAAKTLIKLTSIDRLKHSIASSGGVDALIEILGDKKGLRFQKDAIASLIGLLRGHDENKARAVRRGLPSVLLRLVVYASPEEYDMDGILELMGILATSEGGHDVLVQINTTQALIMLVKCGKLVPQREKAIQVVQTLTSDCKQDPHEKFPNGGDEESLAKSTSIDQTHVPSNGTGKDGHENGENKLKRSTSSEKIPQELSSGYNIPHKGGAKKRDTWNSDNNTHHASNGNSKKGEHENDNFQPGIQGPAGQVDPVGTQNGPLVPQEFRCWLSKTLMKDPVIVSTGETYERQAIQEWLDSGKITCPKTRYWLRHMHLKPNIKLRAKISNWCERNSVGIAPNETDQTNDEDQQDQQQEEQREEEYELSPAHSEEPAREPRQQPSPGLNRYSTFSDWTPANDRHTGSTQDPNVQSSNDKRGDQDRTTTSGSVVDVRTDANNLDPEYDEEDLLPGELNDRPATDEEIERVQTLMEVLSSEKSSEHDLRAAALELHDLAFGCQSLRDEIVLVGAEDGLASLLSPEHRDSTQEAGIATLLILSLNDENKKRMAHSRSTVVPAVVGLLMKGSEDGREKAASTLFSLSIPDENKVSIGASDAIPALVDILSGRDPLSRKAQKDAATCLLTLSIYLGNKARAVRAGVVPYLVALLDDKSLLDLVLAMLAVLSSHVEGREAIEEETAILPKLTQILRSGTDRNIENALTVFTALTVKKPALFKEAERLGADKTMWELCQTSGSAKIKSMTVKLLQFVERYNNSSTQA